MPEPERAPSDKRALSPDARSDEDVTKAIARMIRSLARRCAEADPDTAHLLRQLDSELDTAFALAVNGWRASGFSDTQIGAELGVTKQAVQQRWPRPRRNPLPLNIDTPERTAKFLLLLDTPPEQVAIAVQDAFPDLAPNETARIVAEAKQFTDQVEADERELLDRDAIQKEHE